MPHGSPYNVTMMMAPSTAGSHEHDDGGSEGSTAAAVVEEAMVPPGPPLLLVQFWLPGFPAYKVSMVSHPSGDDDRGLRQRHCDQASSASSVMLSLLVASSHLLLLPVSLVLGACHACVYTPVFQGINLWAMHPLGAREKLAMYNVVGMLGHIYTCISGHRSMGCAPPWYT